MSREKLIQYLYRCEKKQWLRAIAYYDDNNRVYKMDIQINYKSKYFTTVMKKIMESSKEHFISAIDTQKYYALPRAKITITLI